MNLAEKPSKRKRVLGYESFFLQNTLRPAQDLKGETKKQIASVKITESLA